jgi:erythronate-4-phosphate dehydrogenase
MIVNSLCNFFDLPLNNWYPENIPQPPAPEIMIDGKGKSDVDIISEAVSHTYHITADDIKLRFSPSDFEKQRGDYPLRREFPSFTVKLNNCTIKSQETLENLGFRIST